MTDLRDLVAIQFHLYILQTRYQVKFHRDGRDEWNLFRSIGDGRLEWLHFSDDYVGRYNGMKNYCCRGIAEKGILMHIYFSEGFTY